MDFLFFKIYESRYDYRALNFNNRPRGDSEWARSAGQPLQATMRNVQIYENQRCLREQQIFQFLIAFPTNSNRMTSGPHILQLT